MDIITYAMLKSKITSALTGIASIKADDESGRLVFETNDGVLFYISIPGGAIAEDFIVSNGVGKAEKGTAYKAGTALASIVVDMLSTYSPPSITIDTNLNKDVFDKVEESIAALTINTKVIPGTKDVTKVSIFIDNNVIATYEGNTLREDGKYSTVFVFDPAIKETFNIKVTAYDGENTTKLKPMTFVGKSYWGYVDKTVTKPDETAIKELQFNTVKNSRSLTYSEIKVPFGRIVYAYPKNLGALAKIVDEDGRNYTNSYTVYELKVDDIDYYCYLLTDPMGTDNGYQKYS